MQDTEPLEIMHDVITTEVHGMEVYTSPGHLPACIPLGGGIPAAWFGERPLSGGGGDQERAAPLLWRHGHYP